MREALTFGDVCLAPKYNNIESRSAPTLGTDLTTGLQIDIPIVNSPMDSVISYALAEVLAKNGTIPIFDRQADVEEVNESFDGFYFLSCGVETKEFLDKIEKHDRVLGINIDVAHGHSLMMRHAMGHVKQTRPDLQVIAGAVCTREGYVDLASWGADAIRIGVGPGSACTTRMVTGFGIPQFTSIQECAAAANRLQVPIISDGGIQGSRDIVLALAAGAQSVMVGKLFACTEESGADKKFNCANYRGQASWEYQKDYGQLKPGIVPEGVDFWSPITGSAQQLIDNLVGGIRSGLTYGGAIDIPELQRKAEFVRVTSTYMRESMPREN